ncbi:MAG: phosphopantothenoylcysteine decarboxylase, partial [Oligoflexia bacterium]|nr:phosphopantothenoylcysteine decarboxylase [Oligoflexia bacterium]
PRPGRVARILDYGSFAELDGALREVLQEGDFGAVVHLAAVSDYSVGSIEVGGRPQAPGVIGKIRSDEELVLRLKPNFKIVERIKGYVPGPKPLLIAFKLTHTPSAEERVAAVRKLAGSGAPDFIVHNDLGDREKGQPVFRLFETRGGRCHEVRNFASREELAQGLVHVVQGELR